MREGKEKKKKRKGGKEHGESICVYVRRERENYCAYTMCIY